MGGNLDKRLKGLGISESGKTHISLSILHSYYLWGWGENAHQRKHIMNKETNSTKYRSKLKKKPIRNTGNVSIIFNCLVETKEEPKVISKNEIERLRKQAIQYERKAGNKANRDKIKQDRESRLDFLLKIENRTSIQNKHIRRLQRKLGLPVTKNPLAKGRSKKKKTKRKYKNRIPSKYETYINSPHWEKRKNEYYQKYPRVCSVCASCKHIHLHHAVYAEYGKEQDGHLFPLCDDHHSEFHKLIGKTKRDMLKETLDFIQERRLGFNL